MSTDQLAYCNIEPFDDRSRARKTRKVPATANAKPFVVANPASSNHPMVFTGFLKDLEFQRQFAALQLGADHDYTTGPKVEDSRMMIHVKTNTTTNWTPEETASMAEQSETTRENTRQEPEEKSEVESEVTHGLKRQFAEADLD